MIIEFTDGKMEENYRRLNIKSDKYMNDKDCRPSGAKTKIIGDLNGAIKNCLDLEISSMENIQASKGTLYLKKGFLNTDSLYYLIVRTNNRTITNKITLTPENKNWVGNGNNLKII